MNQGIETADIALLAPVPLKHLESGRAKVQQEGRVAYGSRAWELFQRLDTLRNRLPVDVFIYASHDDAARYRPGVRWKARYIQSRKSNNGSHPEGARYRPDSTHDDTNDSAVFWEIEDLEELPEEAWIQLARLTPYGKRKPYGHPFVPQGPILIERP